jgi:predicted PurR-regulated permease PerM
MAAKGLINIAGVGECMKKIIAEKKHLALFMLAALALFLGYAAMPLLGGIFGAAVMYVIFKPTYLWLESRTGRKGISAAIVMLLSLILVLIPFGYLAFVALDEALSIAMHMDVVTSQVETALTGMGVSVPGVEQYAAANIQVLAGTATAFLISTANSTVEMVINVVVLYLIFFYALTERETVRKAIKSAIPFSEANADRLIIGFNDIVKTTVVGNGIVAVAMGVLFALGLQAVGASNLFFWIVIGSITAFLPMLGVQFVSIPAALYFIFTGNVNAGIGIFLWGSFLSYIVDGLLRQAVQKKLGNLHPFYSLMGLLIGIAYFGIMGIIIGPLILALFVLIVRMFREEYLQEW